MTALRAGVHAQTMRVDTLDAFAQERDREVRGILQSINDLAQIMKDLSVLVIDQGTILDRIDYNMEQARMQPQKRHLPAALRPHPAPFRKRLQACAEWVPSAGHGNEGVLFARAGKPMRMPEVQLVSLDRPGVPMANGHACMRMHAWVLGVLRS